MRATMNLDDRLVEEARELTGITERAALVHEGLRALVEDAPTTPATGRPTLHKEG